ncbi:Lcl C-terminal domain-containing protein [Celeribacter sp. ULVN23_4]
MPTLNKRAATKYASLFLAPLLLSTQVSAAQDLSYPVVDTMQDKCFDLVGDEITCPAPGEELYGQDAQYERTPAAYTDQGDGTVLDDNTGLVWQQTPENDRKQYTDAIAYCEALELGDRTDWRLPSLKELYSLADNRGELLTPEEGEPTPYIDTSVFDFYYPDGRMAFAGQYWSSTLYIKGPVQNGRNQAAFGFNFADGHIKAYGTGLDFYTGAAATGGVGNGQAPGNYVRCVSGDEGVYGVNAFVDNGDGTVTDEATGRMWQQSDDGERREWKEALAYCEGLELGGYDDWYLPDSKELQSIVDYRKNSFPAIDESFFSISEDSETLDFWTSTTFGDWKNYANVIAFGKALSKSGDQTEYTDWHGAGAQRSSIKTIVGQEMTEDTTCSVNACDYNRSDNLVRCVR